MLRRPVNRDGLYHAGEKNRIPTTSRSWFTANDTFHIFYTRRSLTENKTKKVQWLVKVETKRVERSLTAGAACKAILWPTPISERVEGTFNSLGLPAGVTLISASAMPHLGCLMLKTTYLYNAFEFVHNLVNQPSSEFNVQNWMTGVCVSVSVRVAPVRGALSHGDHY